MILGIYSEPHKSPLNTEQTEKTGKSLMSLFTKRAEAARVSGGTSPMRKWRTPLSPLDENGGHFRRGDVTETAVL